MATRQTAWTFVFIASTILLVTSGVRLSLGLFVQPISSTTEISIVQMSFALAVTQLMWGVSVMVTFGYRAKEIKSKYRKPLAEIVEWVE